MFNIDIDSFQTYTGLDDSMRRHLITLMFVVTVFIVAVFGMREDVTELEAADVLFHGLVGDTIESKDYSIIVTNATQESDTIYRVSVKFINQEEFATTPGTFLFCTSTDESPSMVGREIESTYETGVKINEDEQLIRFEFENPCLNAKYIKFEDVRSGEQRWVRLIG